MEDIPNINIESKENLKLILNNIIDDKYKCHIDDWLYTAQPNEKKGLFILSKVHKYKGQKIFKTQIRKTKEEENNISNFNNKEVLKRYYDKMNMKRTTYGDFYGSIVDQKFKYDNILNEKEFSKLDYSQYLKKEMHEYISSWLSVEKSEQYKDYILKFLRSFCSTIKVNQIEKSHYKTHFTEFNQHVKFTLHAPTVKVNETIKFKERVPTYEEMRARLNLDLDNVKKLKNRPNTSVTVRQKIDYESTKETRKQIQETMRGTKKLLSGVNGIFPVSNYYDNFKYYLISFNKFSFLYFLINRNFKHPYPIISYHHPRTSSINGLVPDPYLVKQKSNKMAIGDDLKNFTKTLI